MQFLPMVATVELILDLDTMPFEEAIYRLKTYEKRIKTHGGSRKDQRDHGQDYGSTDNRGRDHGQG